MSYPLTFGVELECAAYSPNARLIAEHNGFTPTHDGSINAIGREHGEIITGVLTAKFDSNKVTVADSAKEKIEALCKCADAVNASCGLHVHLGNGIPSCWNASQIRTFMAVALFNENRFFNLVPDSRTNLRFCRRITELFTPDDFSSEMPILSANNNKYNNPKRYCWINFVETVRHGESTDGASRPGLGTIEIRLLGNTRRFDYVWAWINLWLFIAGHISSTDSSRAIMGLTAGNVMKPYLDAVYRAKTAPENRKVLSNKFPENVIFHKKDGDA